MYVCMHACMYVCTNIYIWVFRRLTIQNHNGDQSTSQRSHQKKQTSHLTHTFSYIIPSHAIFSYTQLSHTQLSHTTNPHSSPQLSRTQLSHIYLCLIIYFPPSSYNLYIYIYQYSFFKYILYIPENSFIRSIFHYLLSFSYLHPVFNIFFYLLKIIIIWNYPVPKYLFFNFYNLKYF